MIDAQMVEIARHFLIERVIAERGIKLRGKIERVGPCPVCAAGRDRFAVNVRKQLWNCRICGEGGSDAISLVRFLDGCDFASAVGDLGRNARPDHRRGSEDQEDRCRAASGRR